MHTTTITVISHNAPTIKTTRHNAPTIKPQAACGGVGPVQVPAAEADGVAVTLPECVPLAALRGHKRSFMRIATQVLGGRVGSEAAVQRMFLEYVAERCR